MADERITWLRGKPRSGPRQSIGVLEVRSAGGCRAACAERTEVDGRSHIGLALQAWGRKDSLDTRWWSLVLDRDHKAYTVRTGSCGDALTTQDVPRVIQALEDLALMTERTMIHVDDGPAVIPWRSRRAPV